MHRSHKILGILVGSIALTGINSPAPGAITFLHHFNSATDWNINPSTGDYSAGDSTATVSVVAPTHGVGYFPDSSPTNGAFHSTGNGQYIEFDSVGGAVDPASGLTVGAWVKIEGNYWGGTLFTVGEPTSTDDYLRIDYGNGLAYTPRVVFRDGDSVAAFNAPVSVDASQWVYLAAAVDTAASQLTLFGYNSAGTSLFTPVVNSIPIIDWNVGRSLASFIRINGQTDGSTTGFWVDELSIDNVALTTDDMNARVAFMAAGNELAIPEPGSFALISGALFMLARRSRRTFH